jgi:RimJ/RimL family protein N-acetyltransferase
VNVLPADTDRLSFRTWTAEDLDALEPMYADADVMRYIGNGLPRSRQDVEEWLDWAMSYIAENGFGPWATLDKATGRLIGRCGFIRRLDHTPDELELLYAFERAAWGRGLASEAVTACIELGFGPLGLERIVALVHPDNLASQRVALKNGLEHVGPVVLEDGREMIRFVLDRPQRH